MLARLLVPHTPHSPLGRGCGTQTLGDVSTALPHVLVRGVGGGEMPWHQDCPMDGPDTQALPELGFAICSHEIFPPFVAASSFGALLQMQPSLCSLIMSAVTFGRSQWWGHVDYSLEGNGTKDVFGRGPTPHAPALCTARFATWPVLPIPEPTPS